MKNQNSFLNFLKNTKKLNRRLGPIYDLNSLHFAFKARRSIIELAGHSIKCTRTSFNVSLYLFLTLLKILFA